MTNKPSSTSTSMQSLSGSQQRHLVDDKQQQEKQQLDELWKHAYKTKINLSSSSKNNNRSHGKNDNNNEDDTCILQLVGLASPTQTVFGRVILFSSSSSSSSPSFSLSILNLLECMINEIWKYYQKHQQFQQQQQHLTAYELLRLGAVWKLDLPTTNTNNNTNNNDNKTRKAGKKKKQKNNNSTINLTTKQLKRTRLFMINADDTWQIRDAKNRNSYNSLRIHFCPNRFPRVHKVNWIIDVADSNSNHNQQQVDHSIQHNGNNSSHYDICNNNRHNGIVHYNIDLGFVVVHKPCGIPSHATVDNGAENVLYQLEIANNNNNNNLLDHQDNDNNNNISSTLISKPSLPQRLDIETDGLLLVAIKPEFSSYMGRLLQQQHIINVQEQATSSTSSSLLTSPVIQKHYKCLADVSNVQARDKLVQLFQASNTTNNTNNDIIITHYMNPNSSVPKTFLETPPLAKANDHNDNNGWLKCMLKIIHVGEIQYWNTNGNNNKNCTTVVVEETSDEEHENFRHSSTIIATATNDTNMIPVIEVHVELLTGRTHQIRGQFAAMNLPIVGDPLYGPSHVSASTTNVTSPTCNCVWDQVRHRRGDGVDLSPHKSLESKTKTNNANNTNRLALQCCSLRFPKPKWIHERKNGKRLHQTLVQNEEKEFYFFRVDKAWWSDL